MMGDKTFLLARVTTASLIGTLGLFTLGSLSVKFKFVSMQFEHQPTAGIEVLLAALWACLPFGIATWWMFRVLKARYSRREAKAVTTAFAVFTPCRSAYRCCSPRALVLLLAQLLASLLQTRC